MTLPFHPLANLFPLMEGDDYAALVADIKANGLRDAIVIFDGLILDGRNRARACEDADCAPRYEPFAGKPSDAITYVLSKNLARRHLNDSQRAWIAARLCGDDPPFGGLLEKEAADRLHVRLRTVERAVVVRKKARPEIRTYVEVGELPIATAAGIADLAESDQVEIVDEIKGAKGPIARMALAALKKRMRAGRERDLAGKQAALPEKKYGVIYADPEWRFEPYSRESGMDRSPDNHYPTSGTDAIMRRPVEQIAAKDCVLFLWATVPMLPDALDVMRAWGFTYKSHAIWNKDRVGTGYWFRNAHELLLVGTKGSPPAPAMGDQWLSVIYAKVGKHSEKPEKVYELIEAYFPNLPKIELNARRARPGWDAWGLEAPECAEPFDSSTGEIFSGRISPDADSSASRPASASASASAEQITQSTLSTADNVPPVQPQVIAQPLEAEEPLLNLESDPLDIPLFLRRTPVASASNSNASAAGPPNEG